MFDVEAATYDVYPLSDETTARALPANRPSHLEGRTHFTLYPQNRAACPSCRASTSRTPRSSSPRTWSVPADGAEGVVICQGGSMAGWSLYVDAQGRPTYLYNWFGHEMSVDRRHRAPWRPASAWSGCGSTTTGEGSARVASPPSTSTASTVASGRVERTVPFIFSMSGETLDVGVDTCSPVGPYPEQFPFTGTIERVEIELGPAPDPTLDEAFEDGQLRGALSQQ